MNAKRYKNKVYGAQFTSSEQKAINAEILSQLGDYLDKNDNEIDAIVLWELHEQLGFGEKRLKKFYQSFRPALERLLRSYEMGDEDQAWLCSRKLEERGINFREWKTEGE